MTYSSDNDESADFDVSTAPKAGHIESLNPWDQFLLMREICGPAFTDNAAIIEVLDTLVKEYGSPGTIPAAAAHLAEHPIFALYQSSLMNGQTYDVLKSIAMMLEYLAEHIRQFALSGHADELGVDIDAQRAALEYVRTIILSTGDSLMEIVLRQDETISNREEKLKILREKSAERLAQTAFTTNAVN